MPCPRERHEQLERLLIGPNGCLVTDSRGRERPEEPDETRTEFQRDIDRVTHSKAFRRLKHKTQVFLQPEGDHYRTRLTHTLEVSRIARTIARALALNEDLTEAIALGHDLGHTPFGHAGERALAALCPGGFTHYEQSLRVVDKLEKGGAGLNLCYETRIGILNHTTGQPVGTREADVVRLADHIAYFNHDLDDAERAGLLRPEDVPPVIREALGDRISRRINAMVVDAVQASADGPICLSEPMQRVYDTFNEFMFAAVYRNPTAKGEESKVLGLLGPVFDHYANHVEDMPPKYRVIAEREGAPRAAADYVSGMTDSYALEVYSRLFIPASWSVK